MIVYETVSGCKESFKNTAVQPNAGYYLWNKISNIKFKGLPESL